MLLNILKKYRKGGFQGLWPNFTTSSTTCSFLSSSWVAFCFGGSYSEFRCSDETAWGHTLNVGGEAYCPLFWDYENVSHTPKINIPNEIINLKFTNLYWKWESWMPMKLILYNFDNLPVSLSYFPGSLLLTVLKVHGHLVYITVIPIALSFNKFWARALVNFIFHWETNTAKDSKLEEFPKPSLFIFNTLSSSVLSFAKRKNCADF